MQDNYFRMNLSSVEQANAVFPLVKHALRRWEGWEENLTLRGNSIFSENNSRMVFDGDYLNAHDLILSICKDIAGKYPDASMSMEAEGKDDEGSLSFREKCTLQNGRFEYKRVIKTQGPCSELDDGAAEDVLDAYNIEDSVYEEVSFEYTTTVTGAFRNGQWRFDSQEAIDTEDWLQEILSGNG